MLRHEASANHEPTRRFRAFSFLSAKGLNVPHYGLAVELTMQGENVHYNDREYCNSITKTCCQPTDSQITMSLKTTAAGITGHQYKGDM